MIKYFMILLISVCLVGCRTTRFDETSTNTPVVSMRYNKYTGEWYEDLWDQFMNAVELSKVTYTLPKAIVIYLVSNVEILDSRPEESTTDFFDGLTVRVVILRWRF